MNTLLADSVLSVLLANINIIADPRAHSPQLRAATESLRRKRRITHQSTKRTSRTFISPCLPSSTAEHYEVVSSTESLNFLPLQETTSALLAARALSKTGGADLDVNNVDTNSTTNDFSAFAWDIFDTILASAGGNGHIPRYAYPFHWNSSHNNNFISGTAYPSAGMFDDTTPIEYMPVETRDAPVIFASGRISSPPFHATMALHSFYLSNQTDADLLGLSRTYGRLERYHRFLHDDVMRGCELEDNGPGDDGNEHEAVPCYNVIHPWESDIEQSSPLWEVALQPIIEQMDSLNWSPSFQIPTEVIKSYDFPRKERVYDAMLYLLECQKNATLTTLARKDFETYLLERCPFAMLDVGNAAALARADQDLLSIGEILYAEDIPRMKSPTRLELKGLATRSERSARILDSLWDEKGRAHLPRAVKFRKSAGSNGTFIPANETVPLVVPVSSRVLAVWGWGDSTPKDIDQKETALAFQLQESEGRSAFHCGEYPIPSIGGCSDRAIIDPTANYLAAYGFVERGLGGLGRYIRNSTLNMICGLPNVDGANLSSCPNNAAFPFPAAYNAQSNTHLNKGGCSSTSTASSAVVFNMFIPDKTFEYTAPPPLSSSWVIFLIALELAFTLGVGLSCVLLSIGMIRRLKMGVDGDTLMRLLRSQRADDSFLYGDSPGDVIDPEDEARDGQRYDILHDDTASAANAAPLGEELGRLQGLEREVGASPIIKASSPLRNVQRFLFRTGVDESGDEE